MASADNTPPRHWTIRETVRSALRWLGSLQLAVPLIVTLAAVLAWATFLEAGKGRAYAQWHVYHAQWFLALLGVLAVNVLAATILRFPWRHKVGFLVTHAGLLVLLAGSIQSFLYGIEGQVSIAEGEMANRMLIGNHTQFTARWNVESGESQVFVLQPGPVDWPDGKTLDMGAIGGVGLKILKFYAQATTEEDWLNDPSGQGRPVLRLALAGADGVPVAEEWLVGDPFGAQLSFGPLKIDLQQATVGSMREDFLHPPGKEMDASGLLSVHYQGKMLRVPVSKNVGKKVPVGDDGVSIEIAEYVPDAQPNAAGRFVSAGKEPKNPLLELRVHLPKGKEPLRQIAFAKAPFLNFDAIHGRTCPVKFWYHHPAYTPEPGVEFLQLPDGRLCCRIGDKGGPRSQEAVRAGDSLELPGRFKLTVVKHIAHARHEVRFLPAEPASGESEGPEAAALVEVAAGGTTRQVWLKRSDPTYGRQTIETPEGALALSFGYEYLPLDFALKLLKFTRGVNPGGMGDASFTSSVQLVDRSQGIDQTREISMNEPLVHGRFTFYQSSFQDSPQGGAVSVLTVAYDPGRLLKYSGSLLICLGLAMMFVARSVTKITRTRSR